MATTPTRPVAALSERLVRGNSTVGGHWCTTAPPRRVIPRSEATWESRGGSCDFADGFPVFRACTARLPRLLRSLAMTSQGGFPHPEGRNDKAESLLLALITSRTRQNRNQPLEIATFPIWKTDPPIQDSSSLSAHLSFCGTNSLSASHARLLLSHPVLFQNKLIYEHDIAL